MTLNQTMLDVCEEALLLLRQDVSLPTLAEAPAATDMEWVKCRKALEYAAAEVLAAHDWTFATTDTIREDFGMWPANIRKLVVYALARELAVQIAGRTEDLKNYHALYEKMLVDARLKDLGDFLKTNTDPVLAELLANFRMDDAGLARTFAVYRSRSDSVSATATIEINAAHNWQKPFAPEDRTHVAWTAYLALCVSKLSIPCGIAAEAVAALENKYLLRLKEARVADLEATPLPDGVIGDVLVFLRGTFSASEAALPRDLKSLADKAERLLALAIRDVLSAHPWSFALEEDFCPCYRLSKPGIGEYGYALDIPGDAIKIVAVYGPYGLLNATRQIAGQIRTSEPITRLVYTRNITEWNELSPDAQRLVTLRLSADMAKAMGADENARKLQEQLYRDALADAKYRDTRETEPGRSVWGRNHYADMMRGEDVLRR